MSRHADVVIVGGGVIGCAVAWSLAREGASVCMLEQRELAAEASGAAAGMLLPYGESRASSAFQRWGSEALDRFPALCDELRAASGVDPEFERSGALYVASDEAAEQELAAKRASFPHAGFEWLDATGARDLAPGLAPAVRAALWSPTESHVRSPQLARAYAAAAESLGTRIVRGVSARELVRRGDDVVGVASSAQTFSAAAVVVCAGAWASDLVPTVLPISPVRGQIVALDNPAPPLRTILLEGDTYLVPKRDGSLVLGATEEGVGFDRRVTPEGVQMLLEGARALVPSLARTGFRGAWAGLRPATPDRLPAVGPVAGAPGLFVAAGHFRNGVLLSPVTGALITAQIQGKSTSPALQAFLPGRFAATSGEPPVDLGAIE